jgi:hypothetical protein
MFSYDYYIYILYKTLLIMRWLRRVRLLSVWQMAFIDIWAWHVKSDFGYTVKPAYNGTARIRIPPPPPPFQEASVSTDTWSLENKSATPSLQTPTASPQNLWNTIWCLFTKFASHPLNAANSLFPNLFRHFFCMFLFHCSRHWKVSRVVAFSQNFIAVLISCLPFFQSH